jgi:ElaB/YqjD/DUF883 family membrane-anchored ribosome-binding protein
MNNIRKHIDLVSTISNMNVDEMFSEKIEQLFESSGLDIAILLENRIEFLKTNILPKLQPLADKESISLDELFELIQKEDPTKKKSYTQWLMTCLVKGKSKFNELSGMHDVIVQYEELKRKNKLENADVGNKSFADVRKDVTNAIGEEEKQLSDSEQQAYNESNIIEKTDQYIVFEPKTEYAAGILGANSMWCTSAG